jgi:hypothetical protein
MGWASSVSRRTPVTWGRLIGLREDFLVASVRSLTVGATFVAALALALTGCTNSGSATAPTTTASTAAPSSSVPSAAPVQPGQGVAATTDAPGSEVAPAPQAQPAPSQSPLANLPLNTTLYPPADVPRTSAGNAKEMAYLQSLQKGGLTVTASGATELTLGHSICSELARGSKVEDMKKLLVPVAAVGATLSKSKLTGEQAADLYLASAQADLC